MNIFSNVLEAKTLAQNIGINGAFYIINPDLYLKKSEAPPHFIERILNEEAQKLTEDCFLLSVKVVFIGRRLVTQPQTQDEAIKLLKLYSGRNHTVVCGICTKKPDGKLIIKRTVTRIKVKALSTQDINNFIETNEWQTIGGYRLDGHFLKFIHKIIGSHTGNLGFPCYEAYNLYKSIKC